MTTRRTVAWRPNPGPQTAFLACPIFEVFFGGAAGGGKSDALLADALTDGDRPKSRVLILRRSYPELRELIQRSRELVPAAYPGARYNATERAWGLPSGARIEFGYVRKDDDVYRYQGQEYTRILWDELTHYTEWAYLYLMSRVRTPDPTIRLAVRATGNPGGKGHAWVKARFIDPAPPLTPIRDEETGTERVFIPSSLKDNPHLGADYGRRLKMLGEQDQRALLHGDWNAYDGAIFRLDAGVHVWSWAQFNAFHGLPRENRSIPADWPRFRTMDWGYARPFAVYWYAVAPGGRAFVYREWYGVAKDSRGRVQANVGVRMEPQAVARRIKGIEADAGETIATGWTGPDLGQHGRGDHGAGKPPIEHFEAEGVFWQFWRAGHGTRREGRLMLAQRLAFERGDDGSMREWPGLVLLEGAAPHAERTLPALEPDEHDPELVATDGEDHAYDSLSGFCKMRPWEPTPPPKPKGWRERLHDDNATDWMVN